MRSSHLHFASVELIRHSKDLADGLVRASRADVAEGVLTEMVRMANSSKAEEQSAAFRMVEAPTLVEQLTAIMLGDCGESSRLALQFLAKLSSHPVPRKAIIRASLLVDIEEMLRAPPLPNSIEARKRALAFLGDLGAVADDARNAICNTPGLLDAVVAIAEHDVEPMFTREIALDAVSSSVCDDLLRHLMMRQPAVGRRLDELCAQIIAANASMPLGSPRLRLVALELTDRLLEAGDHSMGRFLHRTKFAIQGITHDPNTSHTLLLLSRQVLGQFDRSDGQQDLQDKRRQAARAPGQALLQSRMDASGSSSDTESDTLSPLIEAHLSLLRGSAPFPSPRSAERSAEKTTRVLVRAPVGGRSDPGEVVPKLRLDQLPAASQAFQNGEFAPGFDPRSVKLKSRKPATHKRAGIAVPGADSESTTHADARKSLVPMSQNSARGSNLASPGQHALGSGGALESDVRENARARPNIDAPSPRVRHVSSALVSIDSPPSQAEPALAVEISSSQRSPGRRAAQALESVSEIGATPARFFALETPTKVAIAGNGKRGIMTCSFGLSPVLPSSSSHTPHLPSNHRQTLAEEETGLVGEDEDKTFFSSQLVAEYPCIELRAYDSQASASDCQPNVEDELRYSAHSRPLAADSQLRDLARDDNCKMKMQLLPGNSVDIQDGLERTRLEPVIVKPDLGSETVSVSRGDVSTLHQQAAFQSPTSREKGITVSEVSAVEHSAFDKILEPYSTQVIFYPPEKPDVIMAAPCDHNRPLKEKVDVLQEKPIDKLADFNQGIGKGMATCGLRQGLCPYRHLLKEKRVATGLICDLCHETMDAFFSCVDCNWNACHFCHFNATAEQTLSSTPRMTGDRRQVEGLGEMELLPCIMSEDEEDSPVLMRRDQIFEPVNYPQPKDPPSAVNVPSPATTLETRVRQSDVNETDQLPDRCDGGSQSQHDSTVAVQPESRTLPMKESRTLPIVLHAFRLAPNSPPRLKSKTAEGNLIMSESTDNLDDPQESDDVQICSEGKGDEIQGTLSLMLDQTQGNMAPNIVAAEFPLKRLDTEEEVRAEVNVVVSDLVQGVVDAVSHHAEMMKDSSDVVEEVLARLVVSASSLMHDETVTNSSGMENVKQQSSPQNHVQAEAIDVAFESMHGVNGVETHHEEMMTDYSDVVQEVLARVLVRVSSSVHTAEVIQDDRDTISTSAKGNLSNRSAGSQTSVSGFRATQEAAGVLGRVLRSSLVRAAAKTQMQAYAAEKEHLRSLLVKIAMQIDTGDEDQCLVALSSLYQLLPRLHPAEPLGREQSMCIRQCDKQTCGSVSQ